METLSSEYLFKMELISNVADITACLFIMLIMIAATVQEWNRNIHHFMSGLILLLNGISCNVLVRALEFAHRTDGGPDNIQHGGLKPVPAEAPQLDDLSVFDNIKHFISMITAPGSADMLIRVICFIFIFFSIDQLFLQAVSARKPLKRGPGRSRDVILKIVIIASGLSIYLVTDRGEVLTSIIIAYLIAGLYSVLKNENFVLRRIPMVLSVLFPMLTCVLALAVPAMSFTGLALSIMCLILYIEFHTYVEAQLSTREAQLAESRLRLMNEQISSHFIFNSLKTIEDMCRTDPVKAGQTINAFSKYLRTNLDTITAAETIPFEDELEHTKQYIRLEQLEGSIPFKVQYDIGITDFEVPPIVLEPLVENAVKHGVKQCGADTIKISTCSKDGSIMIIVSDNGKLNMREDTDNRNSRRGIAIENIRSRLALQCEGTLEVVYAEHGTVATISIPGADAGF